jgi:ubiquinol-cytochrome c reductase cytochrome c1 subunit
MILRKIAIAAVAALSLSGGAALAAGVGGEVQKVDFSFKGPFGAYDQNQLQRGLQVYTEVCAACHGLRYVPLRTLADEGGPNMPEDQVRAYASQFEIFDAELDDFRPRVETDPFPMSNLENAPDLSLMAKARAGFHGPYGSGINQLFNGIGGPEYIYSLLLGFTGEEKTEAGVTLYENTAYPGQWLAMGPVLYEDQLEYADGASNSMEAVAEDVSAFLMWTAEPKMMARKQTGLVAVIFLSVLTVLLYLTNKRIWMPVKRKEKNA